MKNNVEYSSINYFKFLMAIFVVAIHTEPFVNIQDNYIKILFNNVFQVSVPFFFLASGFLLQKKLFENNGEDVLGEYIKKITKLYLIWSIIYFPLALVEYSYNNYSFVKAFVIYIRDLIFVGQHYNSWILWYLLSTIYACIFIRFFLRKNSIKTIVFIGFLIFILSCLIDLFFIKNAKTELRNVWKLYSLLFGKQGRLFLSFFYIPMGMYIAQSETHKVKTIYIVLLFFLLLCLMPFLNYKQNLFFICPFSIIVFLLCINIKMKSFAISNYLRKLSTGIYFSHLLIWSICYSVKYKTKTYGFEMFVDTVFFSILCTSIFIYFKKLRQMQKQQVESKIE